MVELAYVAVAVAVLAGIIFGPTLHTVPEGFVAVYWVGGALTKTVSSPGFHLKLPLITQSAIVQTSLQTDIIKGIPCGTHGGTMIVFERVEVVNKLRKKHVYETIKSYGVNYDKIWIHDKIHHEINQFCSKNTMQEVLVDKFDTIDEQLEATLQKQCDEYDTGIDIVAVRVTKPRIPAAVMANYESMEVEKTRLLIAREQQRVMELEAITERMKEVVVAETDREVSTIQMERRVQEKQALQKMEAIEDSVHVHRQKSQADAMLNASKKLAEANELMLSDEYMEMLTIEALDANNTLVYGDSIPDAFMGGPLVGQGR